MGFDLMSRLLTWHAGTNEDLFTTLMERYRNMVFRLASKYFKERQDCDDIVQETFLRVYTNMDSMDEKKNITAWIYRIGKNVCLDTLKYRKVRKTVSSLGSDQPDVLEWIHIIPSDEQTPEEKLVHKEEASKIRAMIQNIPSKWRPYIYQRYMLGMSLKEISAANQIPENTAKTYLFRARNDLKKRLVMEAPVNGIQTFS